MNTAYAIGVKKIGNQNNNQTLGWSIDQRPEVITQRGCIGDFEIDIVVGPRGHSKAVLLTLLDRKSRFFWAYLLKDRTVYAVNENLSKFIFTFKGPIHSLTVDCGTEFNRLGVFETQYGIKAYYCHTYRVRLNAVSTNTLTKFCVISTLKEHVLST